MLVTIFDSLCTAIGDGMNMLITIFLGMLDLDLASFLAVFPFFESVYRICRGIAWGLLVLISAFSLGQYAFGSLESRAPQDTPGGILFRSFTAGAMILWGGHLVEFAARLATIPFNEIMRIDVVDPSFGDNFTQGMTIGLVEAIFGTPGAAIDLTIVLFEFLVIVLISWNLLKLMLEICERYLMVGVLVFFSPMVYPTIASGNTSGIFRRWVSMFCSSCLMMSISALCMKLILSAFGTLSSGKYVFLRMLYILALCKISQRMDTYLQQLGVTTAVTGGNLLDDMVGIAHTAGRIFGAGTSHGHGGTVLGGMKGDQPRFGGVLGAVSSGVKAVKNTYRENGSLREMGNAAMRSAVQTYTSTTPAGGAAAAYRQSVIRGETPAENGRAAMKGFAAGAANAAVRVVKPSALAAGRDASLIRPEALRNAASMNLTPVHPTSSSDGTGTIGAGEMSKYISQNKPIPASKAKAYYETNGVGEEPVLDHGDGLRLSSQAIYSGLSMEHVTGRDRNEECCVIRGRNEPVAEAISSSYTKDGSTALKQALCTTVQQSAPEVGERVLMNRSFVLNGNDELGAACIQSSFDGIVPLQGEQIRDVKAENLPDTVDGSGTKITGGRELTFHYSTSLDGLNEPLEHEVRLLDEQAFLSQKVSGLKHAGEYLTYTSSLGCRYYYRDTFTYGGKEYCSHEDQILKSEGKQIPRPKDPITAVSANYRTIRPKWAEKGKRKEEQDE